MSLYLGTNLVSGVATPIEPTKNIGQIIQSTIPLTDAGLHLLDGSLISGSGSYSAFVDYIADLYNDDPTANYFCQAESLQPWTQPVLTSNGTMGGGSYACDASSVESDYYAWKAFDNDTSTRWGSSSNAFPDWITFYSPVPLRVSNVYLHFYVSTEVYSAGEIQGSNDNSTWITLASFNNNSSLELNVPISTNVSYKYIRFYGTATVGSPWGKVAEFKITAQQGQELTAEQAWQQSVTDYGVCGKFVYDSTNNTVRLPKITGFVEGTTDVTALGDLVEAGLPDITGYIEPIMLSNTATGCFDFNESGRSVSSSGSNFYYGGTGFYASRSSSIYGNSSTVQPQAIKVLYYIVIANSTKTDIEVDIDEIATDLNGKADVDLSNVNVSGTSLASGWSMPSSRYINLTLGASGATYTAPANGWVFLQGTASGSNIQLDLGNTKTTVGSRIVLANSGNVGKVLLPVNKGDTYSVYYGSLSTNIFCFVYATGEE